MKIKEYKLVVKYHDTLGKEINDLIVYDKWELYGSPYKVTEMNSAQALVKYESDDAN